MNNRIRTICFLLCLVMLFAMPVSADTNNTYSSSFISSYDSSINIPSGRTLEIWFDVVGKGEMDEIGVESIELERSTNGNSWSLVKTFLPEDYPQMICENTGIALDYVTYTGTYGYYYRAYVTFYASNSRGWGNEFQYSETVYITPPAGFIP